MAAKLPKERTLVGSVPGCADRQVLDACRRLSHREREPEPVPMSGCRSAGTLRQILKLTEELGAANSRQRGAHRSALVIGIGAWQKMQLLHFILGELGNEALCEGSDETAPCVDGTTG